MGGVAGYCRPVDPTGISSWLAHTNRGTPSVEPGVDYYTPTGTPVRAASSGVVVDVGGSIYAATGRYVTVDLDDGRRVRYLHLLRSRVREEQRVQWGEVIADSGASGYGSDFFGEPSRNAAFWNNTGGDHVHMTLWAHQEYKFGRYSTLDPEQYMAEDQSEEDEMSAEAEAQIRAVYAAIFGAPNIEAEQITWAKPHGEKSGVAQYGIFDVLINVQGVNAQNAGRISALQAAVSQLSAGSGVALDMKAIEDAAERGAKEALSGLTLSANVDG